MNILSLNKSPCRATTSEKWGFNSYHEQNLKSRLQSCPKLSVTIGTFWDLNISLPGFGGLIFRAKSTKYTSSGSMFDQICFWGRDPVLPKITFKKVGVWKGLARTHHAIMQETGHFLRFDDRLQLHREDWESCVRKPGTSKTRKTVQSSEMSGKFGNRENAGGKPLGMGAPY